MFDGLSIRARFLISPIIGVFLASILYLSANSIIRQNTEILREISTANLTQISDINEMAIIVSTINSEIVSLLLRSEGMNEEDIYLIGKKQINALHEIQSRLRKNIDEINGLSIAGENVYQRFYELLTVYRSQVTAAIEMSSVDLQQASRELSLAVTKIKPLKQLFLTISEHHINEVSRRASLVEDNLYENNYISELAIGLLSLMVLSAVYFANTTTRKLDEIRRDREIEREESSAKIIQASKLATLGEMATSVAHELNQPLSIIKLAAGSVRQRLSTDSADPEFLMKKLERIEKQTSRAALIIDHMRMFGREANEESTLIDPRRVVSSTLQLVGEQLQLARIEIAVELCEDCHWVLGHSIQMEQVFLNLLTNARDSIIDNGEEAKITLKVFASEKNVCITVEDTGGGIPEKDLERIFEPFFTTKDMNKGTGLGLSVSYGIIRDMGGDITAKNMNTGARFTITLPIVLAS